MKTAIAIICTEHPMHYEHYEVWEIPEKYAKCDELTREELHETGYLLFSFTPDTGDVIIDEVNPGVVVFEEREGRLVRIEEV